ncbi:hypothetical protein DFH07DRAFT_928481 [Mycena maculata]|uniref:DUF6534 domain-containing protein n=1 Tax=Mycena maculata TaxID=230809 RepID=A0AAD7MWX4_9AGAR|nr:hypothetical protein DFH07DRAFT_928481 [Mycena maculata]
MDSVSYFPPGLVVVQVSGPLILASLGDWGLFGALTVQLYLYYQAFPSDRPYIKSLVYIVYSLQLVQTIITAVDSFAAFGSGFGNYVALTELHLSWFSEVIVTSMISLMVQSFYAFRLYSFSKSRIIPVLIVTASLAVSVSGFITAQFSHKAGYVTTINNRRTSISAGVWLSGSALIDVIIAVSMTYYLIIRDTGFRQTHALISKLIRLTIETGALTALAALATLILYLGFPGKGYFILTVNFVPALYANTLLAILNSRLQIVGGRSTYPTSTDIMTFPDFLRSNETNSGAAAQPAPILSVHRDVYLDGEVGGSMEMKPVSDGASA